MRRIETLDDISEGLAALVAADARLAAVVETAVEVPLRRSDPGFASLVSIIVSQQVSRASAQSMMRKLSALADPIEPAAILAGGEDMLRTAGLSRPKQKTILSLAGALEGRAVDLDALCLLEAEDAIAQMTQLHGIGPWTAQIYLLFSAGHPDIFPVKDVALQNAVGRAFGMDKRPGEKDLHVIAEAWSPWRGVAARLFWAYHHATMGRSADAVLTPQDAARETKTG
ncbi:DNA-3-methyladenine glycosylase 2 family protein [Aliihoeflea aestuarii]|jgi:DNA-3-methyladenine glycosylase II|uniref:DNA-3-methyladenine glycosylase family protein n=1 Tax=Aliihoeflea aestuarii TaxID=453840 RepID=UPI00209513BA|nr:DNA-3-methyladenine glycosylase [Aliihoeflea aestuarii]MCO6392615.1 DNA-3-methyladenine glycosylase 2 family protein [Aliihoeflea aestuarii]